MSDYLPIGNALYAEPRHTIDLRPMIDEAIERINFAIDEHIRAKLIALGWTPPAQHNLALAAFDSLTEEQITACRGLLVYHLGGSQQTWSIGEHNEAGGYGIPLTDEEKGMRNAHKNFVIGKILEIASKGC